MKKQKNEIIWNIINSLLAASLVFLGAFADGAITKEGIIIALVAGGVIAFSQFKNYWAKEESEYSAKLFSIIKA